MAPDKRSDGVLVRPDFASESDVATLLAAFDAAMAANSDGRDLADARLLAVRTEVPCRRIALVCTPEIGELVSSVRDRIVNAVKQFFDLSEQWPELTLLSEMRTTDSHPLHADAEQLNSGQWVPNHTHWRTHVGLLYLNTSTADYDGGLLRLPELTRTIAPTAGMLVSFPTGRRHIHEVTAITAGRRLSLAIWLTADPSRAEPWLTPSQQRSIGSRPVTRAAGEENGREANTTRILRLHRLRVAPLEPLSPGTISTRADLSADRLLAVQSSHGHFLYSVHPFDERLQSGPGSLVRQAGCGYAIAWAAESAAHPDRRALLATSARRVVDLLIGRLTTRGGTVFIEDLPKGSRPTRGLLGTIALTLAAIQRAPLACSYEVERQLLIEAISASQRPDGSFRCRTDSSSASDDGRSQEYFPGEALLSLAFEAALGSPPAQSALTAALPWYRAHFRTQPRRAFVLWQLDAWRVWASHSLQAHRADGPDPEECCEFVFEMADWLLQFQVPRAASDPELIGGFASLGRLPGCASACYVEALARACALAQLHSDEARAERYREATRLGLDFVRRLQIMPDAAPLLADPPLAIGATTTSLHDLTIRCDHGQHALTCYMAALETDDLLDHSRKRVKAWMTS